MLKDVDVVSLAPPTIVPRPCPDVGFLNLVMPSVLGMSPVGGIESDPICVAIDDAFCAFARAPSITTFFVVSTVATIVSFVAIAASMDPASPGETTDNSGNPTRIMVIIKLSGGHGFISELPVILSLCPSASMPRYVKGKKRLEPATNKSAGLLKRTQ